MRRHHRSIATTPPEPADRTSEEEADRSGENDLLWAILTETDAPWRPVALYRFRSHVVDGYWDSDRDEVIGQVDRLLARHA